MEYAHAHGIPSQHVSLVKFGGDPVRYEHALLSTLRENKIEIIALAGYMKRLPDAIIEAFENKIMNVHPALLPRFGGNSMYGRNVHEAVLAAGCKVSGATVHLVTSEFDAGAIVMQKCCAVREDDTPESLSQRVRKLEFELYSLAIDLVARGKVIVEGKRARILQ